MSISVLFGGAGDCLKVDSSEWNTNYKYVLVHGLSGWGSYDKIYKYYPYWGTSSGDLMKYLPREVRYVESILRDEILTMDWNESELENDDLKNYKMKAEFYVRQHQDNAVIAKLKTNQPLTSADVKTLEEILWSELGTKQDYENEYGSKPLGEFVREIVGLDMNAAKEAFAEFLDEAYLDSNQIYFVNQIVEYIVHNGLMKDLSVLQDAPFTDNGSIVEVFTDLTLWIGIKRVIDRINANAVAA